MCVQLGLVAAIKLAVVNAYLNVFGRFELGITLLVSLVFPAKIKNIFEGLFACYKREAALGLGNDMVRAPLSLQREGWVCRDGALTERGLLCSGSGGPKGHSCGAKQARRRVSHVTLLGCGPSKPLNLWCSHGRPP
jgi:hypothetical protein